MSFKKCGTVEDRDPELQLKEHTCQNYATRLSDVYESFYVYVCDVDHEGLDPFTDGEIEDLPEAAQARAANKARREVA